MRMHPCRRAEISFAQHGGPEQGVEIDDVFANEVMHLVCRVSLPVVVKHRGVVSALLIAVVLERSHVSDRCI